MNRRSYSSEGIILARKNYGEADRLLTIFSKHYGKIFLLAKGVRKPKSRKRGHVEIFSRVKFSYVKNDHFTMMNEAELLDPYEEIRVDLKRAALAYYFIEVISKITQEGEKNEELYELILDYLFNLKTEIKFKKLRFDFISNLLVILGYWPKDRVLINHDVVLESILERQLNSKRVGEKMLR